jgi:hypothetical protein
MARSAETFSSRKKRHGGTDKSEFQRLWAEYSERFGMNFDADLIAFTEHMRAVRHQIVHDGGQANPFKSQVELGLDSDLTIGSTFPSPSNIRNLYRVRAAVRR